jgi:hypothetical protein
MTRALDYAQRIDDKTRGRIRSYLESREDWNLSRSLKNLVEQAVRDYEHRALVELLQNAHDAHDPRDRAGRVLIRLDEDESEFGVLYVANTGRGFSDSNFDAITDIAQSDKRPEEGIGNKGIGFKSVLQLSRTPEVYSTPCEPGVTPDDRGYCFRFADESDIVDHLHSMGVEVQVSSDVQQDVFHLCLPVPLPQVPAVVDELLIDGYVTVIRLPLKSAEARQEAATQIRQLSDDPPALLFLRRIAELCIQSVASGERSERAMLRTEIRLARIFRPAAGDHRDAARWAAVA